MLKVGGLPVIAGMGDFQTLRASVGTKLLLNGSPWVIGDAATGSVTSDQISDTIIILKLKTVVCLLSPLETN
jgi:hypothetical protein